MENINHQNLNPERIEQWQNLHDGFGVDGKFPKLPAAEPAAVLWVGKKLVGIRQLIEQYIEQKIPGNVMFAELSKAIGEAEAFNFLWELREYIDLVENIFATTQSGVWRTIEKGSIPNMEQLNAMDKWALAQYLILNEGGPALKERMEKQKIDTDQDNVPF